MALFVNLVFLGQAFTIMLVYIWSRRNPYVRMNFFGLLTFKAPFLPWVLFLFSLMLGNSVMVDLVGKSLWIYSITLKTIAITNKSEWIVEQLIIHSNSVYPSSLFSSFIYFLKIRNCCWTCVLLLRGCLPRATWWL